MQALPPPLRDYQQEIIDEIDHIWGIGYKAPVMGLCTGGGKTAISSSLIRQKFDLHKQRALVLVDKVTLVNQFYESLGKWFPESDEKYTIHDRPGRGRVMGTGGFYNCHSRVIVATPQTMARGGNDDDMDFDLSAVEDILTFGPIDLVIYDEAHTAICNRTLKIHNRLLQANPDMLTIGPTATPRRSDGVSLRPIFDSHTKFRGLKWGIEKGILCPIGQVLSLYSETMGTKHKSKLGHFDNRLELMYEAWREYAEGRKTAWFMNSVQDSRDFCLMMQQLGQRIIHIDSEFCINENGQVETDDYARERLLKKYHDDPDLLHVTSYGVLTTGWDCPPISCVVIARHTEDTTLLTQIVGRGTRPHPSKTDLMILDMGTKSLELLLEAEGVLEGYAPREKTVSVEDEEEAEEEIPEDPDDLEEDEVITGKGLIVKELDLLNGFGGSWYRDDDLRWSLQLSDELALVVVSPDPRRAAMIDELRQRFPDTHDEVIEKAYEFRKGYSLWVVRLEQRTNQRTGKPYRVVITTAAPEYVSPYLDLVLDRARPFKVQYGDPKLFRPSQHWRKQPASEKQIKALRQMGYNGPVKTMDEASRLITHYKVVPAVAKSIKAMMKQVTDMYKAMKEAEVAW